MTLPTNNGSKPAATGACRIVLVVAAFLLVTANPMGVRAEAPSDGDGDGVADAMDACPDTDPADLVGSDGCVIVSCESGIDGSGWSSRRAYVTYVVEWAKGAQAAGRLTSRDARALVRRARKSTCGDQALVRCCVFVAFDDEVGQCRIMSESACETLDDRLFDRDGEADDEGAGTCLPNPCLF